jgi:pimeloyl-ACP methyl ester carboxylesterase
MRAVHVDLTFPEDRTLQVGTDDGASLHLSLAGPRPQVVLVHGTLVSNRVMGPIAQRLVARDVGVVGPDLRGHGRSTNGSDELTIDRYARDIDAMLSALPESPVVLVGHSAGGMAALAFAQRPAAARRLAGLVLISTSPVGIAGWKERMAAPILFNGLLGWMLECPRLGRAFARPLFGSDPGEATLDALRTIMAGTSPAAKRSAPRAVFDFDLTPSLNDVDVPVLVIHGDRDRSVRPSLAARLARGLPHARRLTFPDAGHMVVLEEAEAIAAAIAEFVGP